MFKFSMALIFIALMVVTICGQQTNDAKQITALRDTLNRVGSGRDVVVTVTRRDGTKTKGHVKHIRDDGFDIVSWERGSRAAPITIHYDDVAKIKGNGFNWQRGAMIGLKTFKIMTEVLRGACFGPISRCSP